MQFKRGKEVSIHTLQEILVELACRGAFNQYEVPDWATGGTMVEEVMHALQELGNACDEQGIPPGFDEWFMEYCSGAEVDDPEPDFLKTDDEDAEEW